MMRFSRRVVMKTVGHLTQMIPLCRVRLIKNGRQAGRLVDKKWEASVRAGWFFSSRKISVPDFFVHRLEHFKTQCVDKNVLALDHAADFLARFDRTMGAPNRVRTGLKK
jgi:hypothetical protein